MDPWLLNILACPENKTRLAIADPLIVSRVNEMIRAGKVVNRGGANVIDEIEGGLIREDQSRLYPIRDGIPVLLIDEGIPL